VLSINLISRRLLHRGRFHLPGILALLALAAPVAWIIGYALLYSAGAIGLLSGGWTTEHWRTAFRSGHALISLAYGSGISLLVTLASAGIAMSFVLLAPEVRRSRWLTSLLWVPLAMPAIVLGFLTYQLLNPGGLISRLCFNAGLIETATEFPVLVNDSWAIGIIVAGILGQCPALILYLLKLWSVARVDRCIRLAMELGASRRQARLRVAAPMLLQRMRSMLLLNFLWMLGSYEIPLLLGVQYPMMSSVLIQKRSGQFNLLQRPEAFVHATVYFVVVSIGLMLFLAWRRRDE
jgi:putative spermidine/putrescine transport system permease protein